MAQHDQHQPRRGVVGADMAERLAAGGAFVHLLEIGAKQLARAATGAAAPQGAKGGGLERNIVAHGRHIGRVRVIDQMIDQMALVLLGSNSVMQSTMIAQTFGRAPRYSDTFNI